MNKNTTLIRQSPALTLSTKKQQSLAAILNTFTPYPSTTNPKR
jgi:hypothetical protein